MNPNIMAYIASHTSPQPDYMVELEKYTNLNFHNPSMMSSIEQANLLSLISIIKKPNAILEIGTFSGYSALAMARGLLPNGRLDTIETSTEHRDFLIKTFNDSPYRDSIYVHFGKASQVIDTLPFKYDMIFIDADKRGYPAYYRQCVEKLNRGGVLIADNCLWHGKIGSDIATDDLRTQAIDEFNTLITDDERIFNVLIPLRDGLMIGVRNDNVL